MERETNQPGEPVRPPLDPHDPHDPREPGQPADPQYAQHHRRASGPRRRTQALGRWRRHEHPSITGWELVAFYESFEEPRP